MRRFSAFACLDWSGRAVARPKGIALAIARAGTDAPALVARDGGWSRAEVLEWLCEQAAKPADMLIGVDFSPALPFADAGAYFPGWRESPTDARSLWALIDGLCAEDRNFSVGSALAHSQMRRHFRQHRDLGDLFPPGFGRLRVPERRCRETRAGNAYSCFNLIGAAQVGKSSLTGMRVLHRLAGAIPIWPFDPVPAFGPMIVEIYTSIAARAAGRAPGRSKMRDQASLDSALTALGAKPHPGLVRYDDHSTDAIVTAAWLRKVAGDAGFWNPPALTEGIRATEGWTFGVA